MVPGATATHLRTCPFCEATCGLDVTTSNGRVEVEAAAAAAAAP